MMTEMKLRRQGSAQYQARELQVRNHYDHHEDRSTDADAMEKLPEARRAAAGRQRRGLSNDLRLKAMELEEQYAAFKLKIDRKKKEVEDHEDGVEAKTVEKRVVEVRTERSPEKKKKGGGENEEMRGRCYGRYMEKREAKLREETVAKRAQRAAKMKAMEESLEQSLVELKAKIAEAERIDKVFASVMRNKEQRQMLDGMQNEEDLQGNKQAHFIESFSQISNIKTILTSRSVSSSTPRVSVATPTIPKPSSKANANTNLRADTTKHNQLKNSTRNKSISEDISLIKEGKPPRSRSLRSSSSVSPDEPKDLSPLNTNQRMPKPMFKNGTSVGPGVGTGSSSNLAKLKDSMASEAFNKGGEPESSISRRVDSPDTGRDHREKSRLSQASASASETRTQNRNAAAATALSKLNVSVVKYPDSAVDSPASANSQGHRRSFAYAADASDADASCDSPTSSIASWKYMNLNQMTVPAGTSSACKPASAANARQQPRKDAAKGFKRFLKFGRRSKGTDSQANEGDDEVDCCRDSANQYMNGPRKSSVGYSVASYDEFSNGNFYSEEVPAHSWHDSIPGTPANLKLKKDQIPGSPMKGTRSFFSLPSFKNKGGNELKDR